MLLTKTTSKFSCIAFCLLAALLPAPALATKPCMKEPCIDAGNCAEIAEWVAEGTIDDVTHNYKGKPLLKDFADFTLEVTRWVKPHASGQQPSDIDFKVGWCENVRELPKDTSGTFRFYGADAPDSEKPHYLYFERVNSTPPQ